MREDVTETLPADVAFVLKAVLGAEDPVHLALRQQMRHIKVHSRCPCDCGTAYFDLDTHAVEQAQRCSRPGQRFFPRPS